MPVKIKQELIGARRNLGNGFKLLLFKKIELSEYHISLDQLALLVLLMTSVIFLGGYFSNLPNPKFSPYGIATVVTQLFFLSFGVYLFSKIKTPNRNILGLLTMLLSLWPLFHLIWYPLGNHPFFYYWDFFSEQKYLYMGLNIWFAAAVIVAIARNIQANSNAVIPILLIYAIGVGFPSHYINFGSFWYPNSPAEETEAASYTEINQEETYYRQFQLLTTAKQNLLKQRDGIADLYFVGFGSYDSQDVFMKEVLYAHDLFDERFDTKGRSIALINNEKTLETHLLASKSNLNIILEHLGQLMDPEEDILFLYLTSHGSKRHYLSVEQRSLELNSINPEELRKLLDNSRIKNRIILVSACYSGGFIEPLRDKNTLIFTAASADKTSFGCSNKSDFTYFGRAIFKENLSHKYDFIAGFEAAIESIRSREADEKLEHSRPQLYIGDKISTKLARFTREIKDYYRVND